MVFQSDRAREIRQQHSNNVYAAAATCVLSSVMSFTMLSGPSQTNSFKGMSILFSMLISGAGLVHIERSKKVENFNAIEDVLESKNQSFVLGAEATIQQMLAELNSKEQQAYIIESLPEYKQARYVQEYRLQGLVMPLQDRSLPQVAQVQSTIEVRPQLPTFNAKTAQMVDTSWMNHDFFFSSGIVTGDEGSGKTQFLAMIAANILAIAPDVDLKIHNMHYDSSDPWFPNMPIEVEKTFFIRDTREAYQDILNVKSELKRREQEVDKKSRPIVRICDEFQALKDELSADEFKEYISACQQIKNRGRKYAYKIDGKDTGVRVILGTHSVKKGETGIDSSFLNKLVVCLGNSIVDTSAIFPGDFNTKQLIQDMESARAQLTAANLMDPNNIANDRARPAVVRIPSRAPQVLVIPRPDLSQINYSVVDNSGDPKVTLDKPTEKTVKTQGDWLAAFVEHARQNRRIPTDKEIFDFFLTKTGKHVPPEFIAEVKKVIGEELS